MSQFVSSKLITSFIDGTLFILRAESPLLDRLSNSPNTEGPLLTLFFETLEKQPCKQKTV